MPKISINDLPQTYQRSIIIGHYHFKWKKTVIKSVIPNNFGQV